jgi:4-hydroxythreonine-4-phosphate dehydrogenase
MEQEKLKIGITQGDTNGIGWEVILKTLTDTRIAELCTPIVYGSPKAAGYYRNTLHEVESVPFQTIHQASEAKEGRISLRPVGESEIRIEPGVASTVAAKAALDALQAALEDLKRGDIDALVTAPINKESMQSEEFSFTGHTEYLAAQLEGEPLMLMCSERLKVGLAVARSTRSSSSSAFANFAPCSSRTLAWWSPALPYSRSTPMPATEGCSARRSRRSSPRPS